MLDCKAVFFYRFNGRDESPVEPVGDVSFILLNIMPIMIESRLIAGTT